jgi:hypothetical protein
VVLRGRRYAYLAEVGYLLHLFDEFGSAFSSGELSIVDGFRL